MTLPYLRPRSPQERKDRAQAEIRLSLDAIKHGDLPLDDWSKDCLAHAEGALYRGLYDLAFVDGRLARTPLSERSKRARRPQVPPMSIEQLERCYALAAATPAREYPISF